MRNKDTKNHRFLVCSSEQVHPNKRGENMKNKKGQVTLFIVIAIAIVAIGAILYMFMPQIRSSFGFDRQNPETFLQNCLEEEVLEAIEILSLQGGSINPEGTLTYDNSEVEYLCYTNEYHKTCTMQRPALKNHVENEIKNYISGKMGECLGEMTSNLEKQGYNVVFREGDYNVELLPQRVAVNVDGSLSLKRGDESSTYEGLDVAYGNNLYEFVAIAISITDFESTYGEAETTVYMDYYRDLKVEKKKRSEGSTIYILTNRNTGDKFQFAIRSLAWPAGYGI